MNNSLVENSNTNFGLNLMRFGAVLMVVFGHLMLYRPSGAIISSQLAPLFGFLGVEVLIVLSGFLIGKYFFEVLIDETALSSVMLWRSFKKMLWRILPLYYLILVLVIALTFLFGQSDFISWKYFFFLQNFSTSMPAFFPESWSFSLVFFGLLFFSVLLSVLFSVRQSARKSNLILAFTIVLILISMVCKWRYYQASHNMTLVAWDQNIKSVVVFRLDSFYIGVLCAWMYLNYRSFCINNCKVLFLIGALLMVFLYVGVGYFHFFIDAQPFFWEVLYLPLTSIAISLLFPFFLQLTSRSKLINRFSTFGAKISYSLFLVHYSILLQIFNQYLMFSNTTVTVFLIFSAFYLLTALLVSYVLYRFYELPLFRISTKS